MKVDIERLDLAMGDTIKNLKEEIKQLTTKVQKARETENWGTYKNLILAYKEIIKLYQDIMEDVYKNDTNNTKETNNNITIGFDKDTSGLVAETIKGVFKCWHNDGAYSELSSDGFVRKDNPDIRIINLFDEFDLYKCVNLEDNSMTLKIDMNKILSRRLSDGSLNKQTLIDVTGFRGIGKTHELIKFAKEWCYLVIVNNEYVAENLRQEYGYSYIYSQKSNQLAGIEIKECVIDEGVDYRHIKDELGLSIVTGYTNKVKKILK